MIDPLDVRKPDHPIESLFLRRWSSRALSGEPITDAEMLTLFEAARWAPSTYNEQEWRFVYARRDTPPWTNLFDLLEPVNRTWCERAAMLVVILAHRVFQGSGKPNSVHLFDCGAAFENAALQGTALGLVVHGMQGFDVERARTTLGVPEDWAVAAMFAVGRPGDPALLPAAMRARETPPGRKPVAELIREGAFS